MLCTVGDDIGFGAFHIRCVQLDVCVAIQSVALHVVETVDEAGATIGVDEVVAAMDRDRYGIGLLGCRQSKRNRQHDGIAVGHDRGTHCFLGVMAIRHLDIISQSRACQMCADGSDVDDMVRHRQPLCAERCKLQFLFMALAIIERDECKQLMFRRDFMRKRNRVQSAGADDDCFHSLDPLF